MAAPGKLIGSRYVTNKDKKRKRTAASRILSSIILFSMINPQDVVKEHLVMMLMMSYSMTYKATLWLYGFQTILLFVMHE